MPRSGKKKKSRKKGRSLQPPQDRPMDLQSASVFFRLPRELRDQIYTTLFASTRLTFGKRSINRITTQKMKPAPYSLAILRSCRRTHEEARSLWLGNVLFSFEHAEDLMDRLSHLPETIILQIRHIRTGGRPVMMMPPDSEDDVYYRVPYVLKLLPGLRLDTLTILGDTGPQVAYQTLEMFIQYGHGWKELYFVTNNSSMLAFAADSMFFGPPTYRREPQPETWHEALLKRDGRDSGASVSIYRSTCPGVQGSVLNPGTRQPFSQTMSSHKELEDFGKTADQELLTGDEERKELLVVVKRGRDANISDVGSPPYSFHDLRQWTNGRPWAQIKQECIDYLHSCLSDSDQLFSNSGEEEAEADVYDDPDEYIFPQAF